MTARSFQLSRVRGIAPAAAAVLALLASGCGGDVTVSGGGGAGLVDEGRLTAGDGAGSAARRAAAWRILGDGVGSGADRTALVTTFELADLSAGKMAAAAGHYPRDGALRRGYRRQDTTGALDRTSANGLWRHRADANAYRAYVTADSGVTQSAQAYCRSGFGICRNSDAVAVELGYSGGQVTYKVGYTDLPSGANEVFQNWTLDSEHALAPGDRPSNGGESTNKARNAANKDFETLGAALPANVQRWSDGGRQGALFRHESRQSKLWLAIDTDYSGAGDTDWLATGIWALTPNDGAANKYRFGVFADGGDVFSTAGVAGLTGSATYTGRAGGVWSTVSGTARSNAFFEADVALTADFDATELNGLPHFAHGVVSGRVHNFATDAAIPGAPELTLAGAAIGMTGYAGGGHRGSTSMTFDGATWTGTWGGQFFGNPAAGATGAAALPGSVAGTFGAATGSGDSVRSFVGAFGAHR